MSLFATREALVSSGTIRASSIAQVSERAAWATPKLSTTFRGRGTSIVLDASVMRTVATMVAAVNPAVAKSVNTHFSPLAINAFEHWPAPPPGPPKRTGLSKSLLALEISTDAGGGELTASLVNTAPYALFIQRGGIARGLIWKPGAAAADAMAEEIGKDLSE